MGAVLRQPTLAMTAQATGGSRRTRAANQNPKHQRVRNTKRRVGGGTFGTVSPRTDRCAADEEQPPKASVTGRQ